MDLQPKDLIDIEAFVSARHWYRAKLTEADTAAMVEQIRTERGVFLARQRYHKKVSIWAVYWPSQNRVVPVLYKAGQVREILPSKNIEKVSA